MGNAGRNYTRSFGRYLTREGLAGSMKAYSISNIGEGRFRVYLLRSDTIWNWLLSSLPAQGVELEIDPCEYENVRNSLYSAAKYAGKVVRVEHVKRGERGLIRVLDVSKKICPPQGTVERLRESA